MIELAKMAGIKTKDESCKSINNSDKQIKENSNKLNDKSENLSGHFKFYEPKDNEIIDQADCYTNSLEDPNKFNIIENITES